MRDVICGTAGHIDHGKTSLLKALTGIDADRLAEEKRRGITIDLGFAHLRLGDFRIGFVDVPGHERFVKNMLAGIGGIQFVLMVVAADESIMPQTVEHFQICKLLEIPDGIVVLTKKGLVDAELLELVREEVAEMVAGTFLEDAPVVAVDSPSGDGIEELKQAMLARLAQRRAPEPRREGSIFRLPVDRVFTLKGFGTVVTGTPVAGVLKKDSPVTAYPRGVQGKVRSVQVFGEKEEEAAAGQRTALNLVGLDRAQLERGVVLAPPSAFTPSQVLDASLTLLPDAPAPLKHRGPARFHHGSGEVIARVYLLEGKELQAGQTGIVQLRLEHPTVCCVGDHYILRRYSPMRTLGGGAILDSQPPKRKRRASVAAKAELQALLESRSQGQEVFQLAFLRHCVRQRARAGITVKELAGRLGIAEKTVLRRLESLPEATLVPQEPPLAVETRALEDSKKEIVEFLVRFHEQNPLAAGASQEEVKKRFLDGAAPAYFLFVLEQLRSEKKAQAEGGVVRIHGSEVELSEKQEAIRRRLLDLFSEKQLQSPSFPEIVGKLDFPAAQVEEIFYFLVKTGALVRISGDLVLSRPQLDWLETSVRAAFQESGFGVSEFKDLFCVTRKYAIPLLEYLDRQRITRRVGDQRIVL